MPVVIVAVVVAYVVTARLTPLPQPEAATRPRPSRRPSATASDRHETSNFRYTAFAWVLTVLAET